MNDINPDFEQIKKYLNEPCVNQEYFEMTIQHYMNKSNYSFTKATKLIKSRCNNDNNLYFFWAYYCESFLYSEWFREEEMFKFWNNHNKEIDKLKDLFEIFSYQYKLKVNEDLIKPEFILNSISFQLVNSKNETKTFAIKSHLLLSYLIQNLRNEVEKLSPHNKPNEKNPKTYFKNFIISTKPLFHYLKASHFSKESNNKTYEYIGDFLNTIGADLEKIYQAPTTETLKKFYKMG